MRLGGINVGLLSLLSAAAYQNHQPVTVATEIDAVAGTKIDPVFQKRQRA
jgi:hypothetical protein